MERRERNHRSHAAVCGCCFFDAPTRAPSRFLFETCTGGGCEWARSKVASLAKCREAMWSAVKGMGGVMGQGAFYFLVPVPVEEDRAIDVLAKQWGVLTTPGRYGIA